MIPGSPAWKPQAMLAVLTTSSMASSLPRLHAPSPSPMSLANATCAATRRVSRTALVQTRSPWRRLCRLPWLRGDPASWGATIEGDFVVFLIGARLDKLHRSAPCATSAERGMPYMLKYLSERPREGAARLRDPRFDERPVLAPLRAPRAVRQGRLRPAPGRVAEVLEAGRQGSPLGDLAETFLVRAGEYGARYHGNMPAYGLAKASSVASIGADSSARGRLRRS